MSTHAGMVLQTIAGQFSGGGYVGNGVGVLTIQRTYSAFFRCAGAKSATSLCCGPHLYLWV